MVELVRAGRTPESLAKEFEPSAVSIRKWVEQADADEGKSDGLTTEERAELQKLRRDAVLGRSGPQASCSSPGAVRTSAPLHVDHRIGR